MADGGPGHGGQAIHTAVRRMATQWTVVATNLTLADVGERTKTLLAEGAHFPNLSVFESTNSTHAEIQSHQYLSGPRHTPHHCAHCVSRGPKAWSAVLRLCGHDNIIWPTFEQGATAFRAVPSVAHAADYFTNTHTQKSNRNQYTSGLRHTPHHCAHCVSRGPKA